MGFNSNSLSANTTSVEDLNTNGSVYVQKMDANATGDSVNGAVTEELDLYATDSEASKVTLSSGKTYDLAGLEPEDIEALVGSMSKEEYAEFIAGMKEYNQYERDYLQTLLDGKDGQPGVAFYNEDLVFDWDWEPQWHNKNMYYRAICHFTATLGPDGKEFYFEDYLGIDWEKFFAMSYEEQIDFLENSKAFDKYFGFSYSEYLERIESGEETIDDIINSIDYNNPDFSVAPGDDTFLRSLLVFENYREQLLDVVKEDYETESKWSQEAVEDYGEEFGCKNIAELYATKEQLKATEKEIKDSMSMLDNKINSMEYDNLYYLKDYQDFSMRTEFSEEEIEQYFEFARDTSTWYTPADYIALHPEYSEAEVIFLHQQAMGDLGGFLLVDNTDYVIKFLNLYKSHPQYLKTLLYLQKYDPDAVYDYLDKIDYQLNQVYGEYEAQEFLSKLGYGDEDEYTTLEKIANELQVDLQGLLDGLGSFADGVGYTVEAIWTFFFGGEEDENRTYSVDDYKKMYILQALLSEEEKEKAGLIVKDPNTGEYVNANPNSLINYAISYSSFGSGLSSNYEVSQGIGNMLPSIALSAVNPFAGSLALGVSAGGNSYHQAMVEGHSFMSSVLYGLYSGATETITEKLFGGLPLLSDVKITGVGSYFASMGKEAFQEGIQELMDMGFCAWKWGEEFDSNEILSRVSKSAFYGAVIAGIMNVPRLASVADAKIQERKLKTAAVTVAGVDATTDSSNGNNQQKSDTKVQGTDITSTNTSSTETAVQDIKVSNQTVEDTTKVTDNKVEDSVKSIEVVPPSLDTDTTGPVLDASSIEDVILPATVSLEDTATSKFDGSVIEDVAVNEEGLSEITENNSFDEETVDDASASITTTISDAEMTALQTKTGFAFCEDVAMMAEVVSIMEATGITDLNANLKKSYTEIYKKLSTREAKISFYTEMVILDSLSWTKGVHEYIAARMYETETGKNFYGLSAEERTNYIKSRENDINNLSELQMKFYKSDLAVARQAVADTTIKRLEWMEECGCFKDGITYLDVLGYIMDSTSPETYLTDSHVADWKAKWGTPDANGNVKIVTFQTADVGGPGAASFGGSIGRSEGVYVMSYETYESIINDSRLYGEDGKFDTVKLMDRLGGVKIGEQPVAIVQNVNINDIKLPTGNLDGAFIGDWIPGGFTSSGEYVTNVDGSRSLVDATVEGVVPYANVFNEDGTLNPNVSLELLTDTQRADYINRAAESRLSNALFNAKKYGDTPSNISDIFSAIIICEECGVDIPTEVQTHLDSLQSNQIIDTIKYCQENKLTDRINEIMSFKNVNKPYFINMTKVVLETSMNYYETAKNFALDAKNFKTYRNHCEQHVQEVAIKSLQAAESIKSSLETNPVKGFSSDIDPYECFVAGIWHDTGMAAGSPAVFGLDSYIENGNIKARVLVETKDGDVTRSNHSFNSAMYVLANASEVSALGVDSNLVALLCFAHSKSNSGVSVLNDASDWSVCINKINEGVKTYNAEHPNDPITFSNTGGTDFIESLVASGVLDDTNYIVKTKTDKKGNKFSYKEYNINSNSLGKLASEAFAIRLGDANTNNSNIGTNQAGQKIDFSSVSGDKNISWTTTTVSEDGETVSVFNNLPAELAREVPGLSIKIGDEVVELDPFGAAFILGEENIDFSSGVNEEGFLVEKFSIKNPADIPACTAFNIDERLGEVNTAKKGGYETVVEIELDSTNVADSQRSDIENYYDSFMKSRGYDYTITWK